MTSYSKELQQTFGFNEDDGLRQEQVVLECEAVTFNGLAMAWEGVIGDIVSIGSSADELNEPVLLRAHAIVRERVKQVEREVVEDCLRKRRRTTVAEAMKNSEKLQACLKEQRQLCDLPPGECPTQSLLPCIMDAMVGFKSREKELAEERRLHRIRLEIRHVIGRKEEPELVLAATRSSRHP